MIKNLVLAQKLPRIAKISTSKSGASAIKEAEKISSSPHWQLHYGGGIFTSYMVLFMYIHEQYRLLSIGHSCYTACDNYLYIPMPYKHRTLGTIFRRDQL